MSYPIEYGLDKVESSSWTVVVQRVLQLPRELVKSGTRLVAESQGSVITRLTR